MPLLTDAEVVHGAPAHQEQVSSADPEDSVGTCITVWVLRSSFFKLGQSPPLHASLKPSAPILLPSESNADCTEVDGSHVGPVGSH